MDKFMMALSKEEQDESFQLLKLLDVQELILRFSALTGINLKTDAIPVLDGGISKMCDFPISVFMIRCDGLRLRAESTQICSSWKPRRRR